MAEKLFHPVNIDGKILRSQHLALKKCVILPSPRDNESKIRVLGVAIPGGLQPGKSGVFVSYANGRCEVEFPAPPATLTPTGRGDYHALKNGKLTVSISADIFWDYFRA